MALQRLQSDFGMGQKRAAEMLISVYCLALLTGTCRGIQG